MAPTLPEIDMPPSCLFCGGSCISPTAIFGNRDRIPIAHMFCDFGYCEKCLLKYLGAHFKRRIDLERLAVWLDDKLDKAPDECNHEPGATLKTREWPQYYCKHCGKYIVTRESEIWKPNTQVQEGDILRTRNAVWEIKLKGE